MISLKTIETSPSQGRVMSQVTGDITEREAQKEKPFRRAPRDRNTHGFVVGKESPWAVYNYLEVEPFQISHSWTKRTGERQPRSPSLRLPLELATGRWG